METITCTKCGNKNEVRSYFCKKCGCFLLENNLISGDAASEHEMKLARIAENLKKNPHWDILWDDTIDLYTKKIERIQSLLRIDDLGISSDELTDKINTFLRMCRKPDFEIAFVGAVKAGKSTLINAILGKNYASTDPNPETAVLTKFRSSEQDYIRVKFYSEKEWGKLWKSVQRDAEKFLELYRDLNAEKYKNEWINHKELYINLSSNEIEAELKKWSSSQSAVHFFVKEIEVGISSLSKDFPKQVVLVDTPGLFDPVAFRSQISIDYIQSANAVLVCVKAEDLHGEEVKTVESVFSFSGHMRNKVFVVATNWDKLNNVIDVWNKRYNYMISSFTGKAFFPTKDMAKRNIMYVDSFHYNLCRDYNSLRNTQKNAVNIFVAKIQNDIEDCDERNVEVPQEIRKLMDASLGMLSPSDIANLMHIMNVDYVRNMIITELVSQYKQLLYGKIKNLYEDILHMVKRIAGERQETIKERITVSYSDMQEIEKKVEETKIKRDEIQKVQKQLTVALNNINAKTQKRLDGILSKIG